MYAEVLLEVPAVRNAVTVPEEAVIHSGERNIVVLALGDGTFQAREVTLGVNGNGLWEVIEGIDAGQEIVVSAQFLIDSESSLREAARKMLSAREKGSSSENREMSALPK